MLFLIIGILAFMVIYSLAGAEAERRGDGWGVNSAQGAVSLGWIVLGVLCLLGLVRGC